MGVMKKLVWGFSAVLVVPVLVMLALVVLVKPNDYKGLIQQKAAEQGIDLVIAGDIGWTFFPHPGFSVVNIEAAIPTGKEKLPVKVGELALALKLSSLLSGQVEIGRLNVRDASATLQNSNGESPVLQEIMITLTDMTVDGDYFPLAVSLQFQQRGLQAKLELTADVSAFLEKRQYALRGVQIKMDATGEALPKGELAVQLSFPSAELDVIADTLKISDLDWRVANLKLTTQIAVSHLQRLPQIKVEPLFLTLDDTKIEGFLHYAAGNPSNTVLRLNGDTLDIDRYLPASNASVPVAKPPVVSSTATEDKQNTQPANQQSSSDTLSFSGLLAFPGDYHLAFGKLLVNHMQLANSIVAVTVAGDTVTLREFSTDAYQGTVRASGKLTAPAAGDPVLSLSLNAKHVQLPPLLTDVQQQPSKIAAGHLTIDTQLSSTPVSSQQILATLSGKAQLSVDGLVINELNIEQRVCEAAAKVDGKSLPAKAWSAGTAFKDMKGTALIRNGVVQLSPIVARLETLDLSGEGSVNLLDSTINLPLDLTLLHNETASNFCEVINPRLADIQWPLLCEGNYLTQSGKELCGIDKSRLDEVVKQAAQKKLEGKLDEKLKEKFGADADKLKESLKGLFH